MNDSADLAVAPRIVGRYALFDEIAAGGMATVHLGCLLGQRGFSRVVAIKRLHQQFAKDLEFTSMFLDEARLSSRIQHPNVVSTLDVISQDNEMFLVMEYVHGQPLSKLVRHAAMRGQRLAPHVAISIMSGFLHGLHAAHEARSETREPLNIVHRNVCPQNVMVGTDGIARVIDFGIAKASLRSGATRDGQIKGKLSYMSPEQINGLDIDRRSDVFAAGIVLWETLVAKRLFAGADAGEILGKVLASEIPPPKRFVPSLPNGLNDAVMKALDRDVDARFQTAREFATALEATGRGATAHAVGSVVEEHCGETLARWASVIERIETYSRNEVAAPAPPRETAGTANLAPPPAPRPSQPEIAARHRATPPTDTRSSEPSPQPAPASGRQVSPKRGWRSVLGLGPKLRVFISYRRADSQHITDRIADELKAKLGDGSVFQDVDNIPYGVDFRDHVSHHLSECKVCLVIIGKKWLEAKDDDGSARLMQDTDHVRLEIEAALGHGETLVVPILVDGAAMPKPGQLPGPLAELAYRNAAQVRPNPHFREDMRKLIASLKAR